MVLLGACAESLIGVTHSVSDSAPNISRRRAKAKNLSCLNTRPFAGDALQRTLAEGLAQGDTENVLCFALAASHLARFVVDLVAQPDLGLMRGAQRKRAGPIGLALFLVLLASWPQPIAPPLT